ncbi:MAG TPA: N-acetylmuramoyl-L-alanine amidase CwlD [Acholeplasmataceae bacterium]|jgi:N-acetylmuramoyl-L-alanine amidase|nr:N-acetylmuramoyl-L-alanine amidase CwlD [Acholeplasmataceae bacterium]
MKRTATTIINLVFLLVLCLTSAGTIIASKRLAAPALIYLDPGHGGADGGAVGADGTAEKDIVLNVCWSLRAYLENAGFRVKMTRTGDYDLAPANSHNRKRDDIHRRCDLIDASDCLFYLSIHANKFFAPSVRGAQVFYNKNRSEAKELAEAIQEALGAILKNTRRFAKPIGGKYLIDNVKKTGCLVEIGFLSNPEEIGLLKDAAYQERMAYAIFTGIMTYFENRAPIRA